MLQNFSFGISTILAVVGTGFAVLGIVGGELKPAAVGCVLIFSAGVFATLYRGACWMSRKPDCNNALRAPAVNQSESR